MAMLTIRDLDDDLEAQLGIRSAFGTRIHQQVMALTRGGLPLPVRSLRRVVPILPDWRYNSGRFRPYPHEKQADEYNI